MVTKLLSNKRPEIGGAVQELGNLDITALEKDISKIETVHFLERMRLLEF